ncbi:MAG: SseB family protein [Rhodobacteraceae bacterium]|nr:SseB family protein [Paracoccaceae bacterium]
MIDTPIDRAHGAMTAAPGDDAARLRFFERVADAELFLMLASDPDGDQITPDIFELPEGAVVLAFDREDRLVQFAGRPVHYAVLSGRIIADMLAPENLGLGLNFEVAPSAILIPSDALIWLTETLSQTPDRLEDGIAELTSPSSIPELVLTAIDAKLARAAGLAEAAYIAGATYKAGGRGHLMAFIGTHPGAEDALAKAVGEALTFSGIEAGSLDIAFFASHDLVAERIANVALRFDLPKLEVSSTLTLVAPGSDPEKPPRLR